MVNSRTVNSMTEVTETKRGIVDETRITTIVLISRDMGTTTPHEEVVVELGVTGDVAWAVVVDQGDTQESLVSINQLGNHGREAKGGISRQV